MAPRARACRTLFFSWCVFFLQYANSFMLTAFFANSVYGKKIGAVLVGFVFAAYPFATALAIPLPPWLVERLGIRATVGIGLILVASGSLLCIFIPALPAGASAATVSAILISLRALCGVGAALAEAGCFTALSMGGYGHRMGLVMSSCEVAIGLGASAGTAIGGALFELGAQTVLGSWRLPFMVSTTGPLVLIVFICALPVKASNEVNPDEGDHGAAADAERACATAPPPADDSTARAAVAEPALRQLGSVGRSDPPGQLVSPVRAPPFSLCCPAYRAIAIASLFFGSAMVEATTPIFQPYANAPPLSLSNAAVGGITSITSITYMVTALPLGVVVDRIVSGPRPTRPLQAILIVGWLGTAVMFTLLGPLGQSAPLAMMISSMTLGGMAAAAIVIPSLPLLKIGVDEADEAANAALCSLWNGMYSGGAAVGPLITSTIFGVHAATQSPAERFRTTCTLLLAFCGSLTLLMVASSAALDAASRRRTCGRARASSTRAGHEPFLSALHDEQSDNSCMITAAGPLLEPLAGARVVNATTTTCVPTTFD
jgi:MFS family permease